MDPSGLLGVPTQGEQARPGPAQKGPGRPVVRQPAVPVGDRRAKLERRLLEPVEQRRPEGLHVAGRQGRSCTAAPSTGLGRHRSTGDTRRRSPAPRPASPAPGRAAGQSRPGRSPRRGRYTRPRGRSGRTARRCRGPAPIRASSATDRPSFQSSFSPYQGRRRVARPAAQAGRPGDPLRQPDRRPGGAPGLLAKPIERLSGPGCPGPVVSAGSSQVKVTSPVSAGLKSRSSPEIDRHHEGGDLVEAVRPLAQDLQEEVHLGRGEHSHRIGGNGNRGPPPRRGRGARSSEDTTWRVGGVPSVGRRRHDSRTVPGLGRPRAAAGQPGCQSQ